MHYANFGLKFTKILSLLPNHRSLPKYSTNPYTESMVAVRRALSSVTPVAIKFSIIY